MIDVILKRFEIPDETRVMVKGKFEIVRLAAVAIPESTMPTCSTEQRAAPTSGPVCLR